MQVRILPAPQTNNMNYAVLHKKKTKEERKGIAFI